MDSALLGVIVGGLIGLATHLVTQTYARRQKWEEARLEVYSRFLREVSVGRRRLENQMRQFSQDPRNWDSEDLLLERQDAWATAIATWNEVYLVSSSDALVKAAGELQIRVVELYRPLQDGQAVSQPDLEAMTLKYETNRRSFMAAAHRELGLRRRITAGIRNTA